LHENLKIVRRIADGGGKPEKGRPSTHRAPTLQSPYRHAKDFCGLELINERPSLPAIHDRDSSHARELNPSYSQAHGTFREANGWGAFARKQSERSRNRLFGNHPKNSGGLVRSKAELEEPRAMRLSRFLKLNQQHRSPKANLIAILAPHVPDHLQGFAVPPSAIPVNNFLGAYDLHLNAKRPETLFAAVKAIPLRPLRYTLQRLLRLLIPTHSCGSVALLFEVLGSVFNFHTQP
jgi:hypothetical protein